jgi:hypothetical protein
VGRWSTLGRRLVVVPVAFLIGAVAPPAMAWHYQKQGWRDRHENYPPRPNGYNEIVNVFGQPCNDRANNNSMLWRASDNGVYYTVNFHKKLGGSTSSNLDNDVKGHIINNHLSEYVRHGIYGYVCRTISNSSAWSTHAWGIAVDVSTAWEPLGQCYSRVNYHHDQIWENHRWRWGLSWCDPHHFQYASGY